MIEKIKDWIKSHKVELIISLVAAGIVFFLVIRGMNFITALIGTITGGLAADVGIKKIKVNKQNKKLDEEKKKKLNKLKEKRIKEDEKINNLSNNDLATDVNKKYKKYRKNK